LPTARNVPDDSGMNTAAVATATASPWVPLIAASVGAAAALIAGVLTQMWTGHRAKQLWDQQRQARQQQWEHERQDRQEQWDRERASRLREKRTVAYEAALTETVDRWIRHASWKRSDAETWTTDYRAKYFASQQGPEWSVAEGRLLAYSTQPILTALNAARFADQAVSQAMDTAGETEKAAGRPLTQEEVSSLLNPVDEALKKSVARDKELIRLLQAYLQELAPDGPPASGPGEPLPG